MCSKFFAATKQIEEELLLTMGFFEREKKERKKRNESTKRAKESEERSKEVSEIEEKKRKGPSILSILFETYVYEE